MEERSIHSPQSDEKQLLTPSPPSEASLRTILRSVLDSGRLLWSKAFKRKCLVRSGSPGYTTGDVINAVCRGRLVAGPRFDPIYRGWEFELADLIDDRSYVVCLILDVDEDLAENPLVYVKSAFFRRGRRRIVAKERKRGDEGSQAEAE